MEVPMNDQSLVRTQLEASAELGSLSSLVKASEVVMLLIDTSGSMTTVMDNGKSRINGLREVVAEILSVGHVPMIAFGGPFDAQVRFVDAVPDPDGGTPLHLAIPFAKQYGASRLVVISDGMPDLKDQCFEEARAFGGRIDIVFVGGGGYRDGGETFMLELARLTGGTSMAGNLGEVKQLSGRIIGLLEGPKEDKAPIQGAGFAVVESEPDDVDDDADDDDEEDDDDTDAE
jgi:hypothetical protein